MFEVGQKVWDFTKGWGVVSGIDSDRYPVVVKIDNGMYSYTKEGKKFGDDINPSLFHHSFEIPKTEIRVKSRDAITRWCLENGYQVEGNGTLRHSSHQTFRWDMFDFCGEIKPNIFTWLPEWLEEVEVI